MPLAQCPGPSQRLGSALTNAFGAPNDPPIKLALVLRAFHAPIIAPCPRDTAAPWEGDCMKCPVPTLAAWVHAFTGGPAYAPGMRPLRYSFAGMLWYAGR